MKSIDKNTMFLCKTIEADTPNANGIIYSKTALRKAIKEFNKKPAGSVPLYVHLDDVCSCDMSKVAGTILDAKLEKNRLVFNAIIYDELLTGKIVNTLYDNMPPGDFAIAPAMMANLDGNKVDPKHDIIIMSASVLPLDDEATRSRYFNQTTLLHANKKIQSKQKKKSKKK